MQAFNYKMKNLKGFVYSSTGRPRDLHLSSTSLTPTKKNVKYDKNQKLIYFFL